jgi:hypothetical protein
VADQIVNSLHSSVARRLHPEIVGYTRCTQGGQPEQFALCCQRSRFLVVAKNQRKMF